MRLFVIAALCSAHVAAQIIIPVFSATQSWRYWDVAEAVPSSWSAAVFDDGQWKSGVGPFGFGSTVAPRTTTGQGNGITTYFRTRVYTATAAGAWSLNGIISTCDVQPVAFVAFVAYSPC